MRYFITGASGFIGRRLVRRLLERPDALVFYLRRVGDPVPEAELATFWGVGAARAIAVEGEITKPNLALPDECLKELTNHVDHVFHLAAIYDLKADANLVLRVNVEGTRQVVRFAETIRGTRFHHISSIAAAGLYRGVFREDMFEEAEGLDHPYLKSKHLSERVVRQECRVPWRIYRPGIVVGDSRTGEMDKIDGPYYFFKSIQKMRRLLPSWMPAVGIEGGRINLVPVDFVVAALDHLAHRPELDGRCFHLTDPDTHRVGDMLNIFARAAHAPAIALRFNAALLDALPQPVMRSLLALSPVKRTRDLAMESLQLPPDILQFVNFPTRFDSREAREILEPAGIRVPALEDYAWRLWDYWERHLDPDLFAERSLKDRVNGRVVLVTGGSSGIGKAVALRLAQAGATTLIVARDRRRLEQSCAEAADAGTRLHPYVADLTDAMACGEFIRLVLEEHGGVEILINNAGHSIRRSIEISFDRFHDFERQMAINFFAALRVTLGLLPAMTARGAGHVINISSIGVLTNAPHFSGYVASKAALEAWSRCAAAEFLDRGVRFTTINMPLVRTAMIAPTRLYDDAPTLDPQQAADIVIDAIIRRPARIATRLGLLGQTVNAVAPRFGQIIMNTAFRLFPDSAAARGKPEAESDTTSEQIALAGLLQGIHL